MGVQNAHPSTAGVYSVTAGTLTQASTSGSGTGATFTPTFNQSDWYYGADDGATINAALGGTAYSGSFLLPAGGCGTTVPIVLPATLPWPSPILRGQGKGLTRLYALGAMAQVIDTGTTYSQGGGLRDLTVDAHKLATDGIMVRRGAVMSFINVAAKNALTAEWGSTPTASAISTSRTRSTAILESIPGRAALDLQFRCVVDDRFEHPRLGLLQCRDRQYQ